MQKRTRKLVDLVCTKGFFLYKCGQISDKCAALLLGLLFVTLWTHGKHGQMQSNDAKRKGLLLMLATRDLEYVQVLRYIGGTSYSYIPISK